MKDKEIKLTRGKLKAILKIKRIPKSERDPKILIAWLIAAALVAWLLFR